MILESVFGGVIGGVMRLAPEVLKFFDRKNERAHEIAMLGAEMDFAKVQGEIAMRQAEVAMTTAEMNSITESAKQQAKMAVKAGKVIAAISALVRPLVTYLFVGMYVAVKWASFLIAMEQGGEWKDVILNLWTKDDAAMLSLILTFWFVGRVWERSRRG